LLGFYILTWFHAFPNYVNDLGMFGSVVAVAFQITLMKFFYFLKIIFDIYKLK